jgi:hypothetical protein
LKAKSQAISTTFQPLFFKRDFDCIFRPKAESDSGSFRTPITVQSGHRFRLIPATFLVRPESEATLDIFSQKGHYASFLKMNEWPERG